MRKEQRYFKRNVALSTEFSRYVCEHPELDDQIPPHAQVVLLPEEEPELCEWNKKLAEVQRENGQVMVYVKVRTRGPKGYSYRIEPQLEEVS